MDLNLEIQLDSCFIQNYIRVLFYRASLRYVRRYYFYLLHWKSRENSINSHYKILYTKMFLLILVFELPKFTVMCRLSGYFSLINTLSQTVSASSACRLAHISTYPWLHSRPRSILYSVENLLSSLVLTRFLRPCETGLLLY